jgi:curved DNA-binding protein CbpA
MDLYKILELERSASQSDIKAAYRRLAKKYHPDKNPNNPKAEELFKNIAAAYDVLGDESKKFEYDNRGVKFERDFSYADVNQTQGPPNNSYKPKKHSYPKNILFGLAMVITSGAMCIWLEWVNPIFDLLFGVSLLMILSNAYHWIKTGKSEGFW